MNDYGDRPQTQSERTQLAWRRTMIGVVAVAGLGSIHLQFGRHYVLGIYVGSIAVLAIIPIVVRLRRLRRGDWGVATWEPVALMAGILALAVGITVLG